MAEALILDSEALNAIANWSERGALANRSRAILGYRACAVSFNTALHCRPPSVSSLPLASAGERRYVEQIRQSALR